MFELKIAGKYLIPRRKHLSRSLIALMSIGVITVVVWLVLLFLSINEGIQKRWLAHLTTLNAPLQITPKDAYYNSYYYQIDEFAAHSDYSKKTIGEKYIASNADPFDPEMDAELPHTFPQPLRNPDGSIKDLVKDLYAAIGMVDRLVVNDYEVAAGVLKLKLTHYDPLQPSRINPTKTLLSQAAYLKSFCGKKGAQNTLFLQPKSEDIEKLIGTLERVNLISNYGSRIFPYMKNMQFTTSPSNWRFPMTLLPEGKEVPAHISSTHGLSRAILGGKNTNGVLIRRENKIQCRFHTGQEETFGRNLFITSEAPLILHVDSVEYEHKHSLDEIGFRIHTAVDGIPMEGIVGWRGITLSHCEVIDHFQEKPQTEPLWPYYAENMESYLLPQIDGYSPIVVPKNLRENGTRIGDTGHVAFASTTATSLQEQEHPLIVVGFYDPGAINVGIRFLLAEPEVVRELNASSTNIPIDRSLLNGVQVWYQDIGKTKNMKNAIEASLKEKGLDEYFSVTAFYEYDQVKDLIQQFQSDQYLFTLVAFIILLVACTNIITLSVLLVNDKKKEIGILRSMGAQTKSIALIFGLCGAIMGIFSTGLGCALAYVTLKNIDTLIQILSALQGHQLFTEAFYGTHLPNTLSPNALLFVIIITPLIALGAGLVPAIKACRLKTAAILRGEG